MSKKKIRVISLLLSFIIIISFITFKNTSVKANQVTTATEPKFTITNLTATPNPAKVGEDILVSGQINPQNFETVVQPKAIVLVLDTSGSMDENVELCNEPRITYCTRHDKSEPHSEWWLSPHKWIHDYCEKHDSKGTHYKTRIDKLKEAANEFIKQMKDVPNLEIGIVKYSGNAKIESDLKRADDPTLITSIKNLDANGGTNTREGLRKAAYLLSKKDSNVNKTVVLMTDGNPTYYSTSNDLNDKDPFRYGSGSWTTNIIMEHTKSLAKDKIGAMKYNAYSIGYGLDTDGKGYLKEIHASMKNLDDNVELNEGNGFFEKSDGSITEIFKQIAENIKNSYELKEISLDIGLNQKSFKLNIGGREIQLDNIIYNKLSTDEEVKETGKAIYNSKPVNFSFIVKGNEEGKNQSILENIRIKFLFNNGYKQENFQVNVKVDIEANDLPNISAELISDEKLEIRKDGEITLKYKINPGDFPFNNAANSGDKDIVVIVELGKKKGDLEALKNGIKNKLTDPFQNEKKAKFSFITFNKDVIKKEATLKSFEDSSNYYHDIRLTVSNLNEGNLFESSTKDITEALRSAYEELERNSRPTATKNIVIISNNDITYTKQIADNIKTKGYNIVSLSLETEQLNKNLYKLHSDLGGKSNSIFNINNDYNDINNSKMDLVREKIVSYAAAKPYEFKPVINLNIGSNFEPVSGIVRLTESGKQNIGVIEIPTIVYNLTQNNIYHAESKIVEIKLKANNLTSGIYSFGEKKDNSIIYKSIIDELVTKSLSTPIITVKPQVKNLIHGLYNGIEDNDLVIDTSLSNLGFVVAEGSTVTYGTSFILTGNEVNFTLNLDDKFKQIDYSEIMAYVVDSGKLIEQGVTVKNTNKANEFKLNIDDSKDSSVERQIVLIYKKKIVEVQGKEDESFINDIIIEDLNSPVTIKLYKPEGNNPKLPDLF